MVDGFITDIVLLKIFLSLHLTFVIFFAIPIHSSLILRWAKNSVIRLKNAFNYSHPVRVCTQLLVVYTLVVELIGANVTGTMNDFVGTNKYSSMGNMSFLVIEEGYITRSGMVDKLNGLPTLSLLPCIAG